MLGYQAQVARNNQTLAEQQAEAVLQRGQVAEQAQRTKTAQILSAQRARLASQGTDISGSPTDILGDTAAAGELSAQTTRNNAAREAWGDQVKASQFSGEAGLDQYRQVNAGLSGLGVGALLLAGAGAVADKWYKYREPSTSIPRVYMDPATGIAPLS